MPPTSSRLSLPLEDLADGDDVDRLAPLVEIQDGGVDGAVVLAIEVVRLEELRDLDDRVLVDEQGTQDRLLGLDGLGRQTVDGHADAPNGQDGSRR